MTGPLRWLRARRELSDDAAVLRRVSAHRDLTAGALSRLAHVPLGRTVGALAGWRAKGGWCRCRVQGSGPWCGGRQTESATRRRSTMPEQQASPRVSTPDTIRGWLPSHVNETGTVLGLSRTWRWSTPAGIWTVKWVSQDGVSLDGPGGEWKLPTSALATLYAVLVALGAIEDADHA